MKHRRHLVCMSLMLCAIMLLSVCNSQSCRRHGDATEGHSFRMGRAQARQRHTENDAKPLGNVSARGFLP